MNKKCIGCNIDFIGKRLESFCKKCRRIENRKKKELPEFEKWKEEMKVKVIKLHIELQKLY